jgi:hypothetical protein
MPGEVAFPGIVLGDDCNGRRAGQIDLACFERYGQDARLVFWEAKCYRSADLHSNEARAPVCNQIERYKNYLSQNRDAVVASYTEVAKNIMCLRKMGLSRQLSTLIEEVANGSRKLELGDEPKVGLVIFGYNEAERDSEHWRKQLQRLRDNIAHVLTGGNARDVRLC